MSRTSSPATERLRRPIALSPVIHTRMKTQRRRDTRPELELRSALHALGLRFRLDRAPVAGMRSRADVVFGPAKVAVFVDGCFWHSCPTHGTLPKNNGRWWTEKLQENAARDARVDRALIGHGWKPLRVWEHDDMCDAARRIRHQVRERGPSLRSEAR